MPIAESEPELFAEAEPEAEPEGEYIPEPEGESVEPESESWMAAKPEGEIWNATLSEYEPEPIAEFDDAAMQNLWVSLYSICMILIVFGDSAIITAILRNKILRRKEANIYLLSLVFSRTMIGLFVVPVRISAIYSEAYLGSILCKLCHWSALGSASSSLCSTLAVSVCKYRETMASNQDMVQAIQPINQKLPKTTEQRPLRKIIGVVAMLWAIGLVYAVRVFYLFDLIELDRNGVKQLGCRADPRHNTANKSFVVIDFIVLFVAPLCLVLYCYVKVLRHTAITIRLKRSITLNDANRDAIEELANSIKAEKKTSLMLVIIMILFVICNLAPNCIKLYGIVNGKKGAAITNSTEQAVYLSAYSNSWINVIVYICFRQDIRTALKDMFRSCCRPRNRVMKVAPASDKASLPVKGKSDDDLKEPTRI